MKNSGTLRLNVVSLALSAFGYALMHLTFDIGNFPLFKGNIGPKNFLPITMGMISGPFGALGVLTGAITAGVLSGAETPALIAEAAGAVIMPVGGWLLWYYGKNPRAIALKSTRDLLRFSAISLALSVVCGLIASLFGLGFWITFCSYMAWNLLLGIPVIMMMTSIFCVRAVYPKWCPIKPDINERFVLEPDCITAISDIIDNLCFAKRLDRKRGFQMQSCIEECIFLLLSEPTCSELHLTARISDSISILIRYDGKLCNPLSKRAHEDLIGLTLIKQRAIRARHRYYGGINHLHIVQ